MRFCHGPGDTLLLGLALLAAANKSPYGPRASFAEPQALSNMASGLLVLLVGAAALVCAQGESQSRLCLAGPHSLRDLSDGSPLCPLSPAICHSHEWRQR